MKHRHGSTGKWHENGTMAWRELRPKQGPNYAFFRGVAFAFLFTGLVVWVMYLISRWI